MPRAFLAVFYDWIEVTQELNEQEKGRLIDAMVLYARGGDWQDRIKGNERYVFPAMKAQIDRSMEISEARSQSGSTGGRPPLSGRDEKANESKPKQKKQSKANESKPKQKKQTKANESEEEEEEEKEEEKEKEEENDVVDRARAEQQQQHPAVLRLSAKDGIFGISERDIAEWSAQYPAAAVRQELQYASAWLANHPARLPALAEMRPWLNNWLLNAQRKSAGKPDNPARQYPQRDYAGADAALPEWITTAWEEQYG